MSLLFLIYYPQLLNATLFNSSTITRTHFPSSTIPSIAQMDLIPLLNVQRIILKTPSPVASYTKTLKTVLNSNSLQNCANMPHNSPQLHSLIILPNQLYIQQNSTLLYSSTMHFITPITPPKVLAPISTFQTHSFHYSQSPNNSQ